jgi:hypothetical protein
MIVKQSQLHTQIPRRTEWPNILTSEQREQLIQEKLVMAAAWRQQMVNHALLKPDFERS